MMHQRGSDGIGCAAVLAVVVVVVAVVEVLAVVQ